MICKTEVNVRAYRDMLK